MHHTLSRKLAVLGICLSAVLITSVLAQSPPEKEKPRLKDFGSSLKRLKWDARTNTAVATERKKRKRTNDDDVVRVETTLVVTDVLVLDKDWRPVTGLTGDDFIVTEDGKPQEVGAFSLGDDAKVGRSIVLIIDYSGSQLPFIQTSIKAAKTLVDKLSPRDRMAIVTDDVELLMDFTGDKEVLKEKLDSLKMKATSGEKTRRKFGRSKQYSALMATLNEAFDDEHQRPVIIFQTDGDELGLLRNAIRDDPAPPVSPPAKREQAQKYHQFMQKYYLKNVTEFSLQDIYRSAENSRATIYTIIPGYRLTGLPPDKQVEKYKANLARTLNAWDVKPESKLSAEEDFRGLSAEKLKQLIDRAVAVQLALAGVAKVTGGWHDFLEDPSQADTIYSLIFSDINRRYVVGYYPTNKEHDGKRRKVTVEVRSHPEYMVWGRKAYYAPGPDE